MTTIKKESVTDSGARFRIVIASDARRKMKGVILRNGAELEIIRQLGIASERFLFISRDVVKRDIIRERATVRQDAKQSDQNGHAPFHGETRAAVAARSMETPVIWARPFNVALPIAPVE